MQIMNFRGFKGRIWKVEGDKASGDVQRCMGIRSQVTKYSWEFGASCRQ